jgi:hypothetical protein
MNNKDICVCGHEKYLHHTNGMCHMRVIKDYLQCTCPSFQPEDKSAGKDYSCGGLAPGCEEGCNGNIEPEPKREWEDDFENFRAILLSPDSDKTYTFGQIKAFIAQEIKEAEARAVREHDATFHPITKHMEMVKDDKAAREEWKKEGKDEQKESDKQTLREGVGKLIRTDGVKGQVDTDIYNEVQGNNQAIHAVLHLIDTL